MFSFKQHMKEVDSNILEGSRKAVYEDWQTGGMSIMSQCRQIYFWIDQEATKHFIR